MFCLRRFEKWVQLSGQEDLLETPIRFLRKNLHYCERHFSPEDIHVTTKMKKLKPYRMPTIFDDNHKPLSDEDMDKWRQMKHYEAIHQPSTPRKRKPAAVVKDPIANDLIIPTAVLAAVPQVGEKQSQPSAIAGIYFLFLLTFPTSGKF